MSNFPSSVAECEELGVPLWNCGCDNHLVCPHAQRVIKDWADSLQLGYCNPLLRCDNCRIVFNNCACEQDDSGGGPQGDFCHDCSPYSSYKEWAKTVGFSYETKYDDIGYMRRLGKVFK